MYRDEAKNLKKLIGRDNSVVIAEGREWIKVEEGIRGINGNGKNTIKINYQKQG